MECKCKICEVLFIPKGKNIRIYCSNKCKFLDATYNKKRISFLKNDKCKNLKCKSCGWVTSDILNKSGIIKKHLYTHNIDIKNVKYTDQFDTIVVNPPKKMKCPLCEWETNDLLNKSGCFTTHIKNKHNLSINEFLETNKEYSHIWKVFQKKINRNNYLCSNENNKISCEICNQSFKILSNTHLSTHNITVNEYKKKYNCNIISNTTKEKFSEHLSKIEKSYQSKGELEIQNYIRSIGNFDIITNTKTIISPFELDIFIRDKNIGIEFNGLYWHSELSGRNKYYHLNKFEKAEKNNIKLLQIFDDEWNNKKEIIKSKILTMLNGETVRKIYARKCKIVSVDLKTKSQFFTENHLQGNDKSNCAYGLLFEDELISVISFSALRSALGNKLKTPGTYELVRFCVLKNVMCVGGFSRLLKHFIKTKNPNKIITYADCRFSNEKNNVYSTCGFKLLNKTKPGYFYTKDYKNRLHRYNFTKHRLIKMGCDPKKTEWETMQELGYDRIWDCGHFKYELIIKK